MKVLVTGNEGYIGSVLADQLVERGHTVVGLDNGVFRDSAFVPRLAKSHVQIYRDIRDVRLDDLVGVDVVVHLAGLSNDPLGQINVDLTKEINHVASVRLAELARSVGVKRFLFSSSCSVYGASFDDMVDESFPLDPKTAYAKAKIGAEKDITELAGDSFVPIFLRNATVYGISPRMRLDLVVNNLTAYGYVTGVVEVLSDGTPWRPLIHIDDVCSAFVFLLEAPVSEINSQVYNVGHQGSNIQIGDLARLIGEELGGVSVRISKKALPDDRSYKVDFSKIYSKGWRPTHTIMSGVREIHDVYMRVGLSESDLTSNEYNTLKKYQLLMASGVLDDRMYMREVVYD